MLLGLVLLAGRRPAAAQTHPPIISREPPLILHLEGTVATSRESAGGFAQPSFEFHGHGEREQRWLGVEKASTIGDHPVLAKDVLEAVRPFRPNFIVPGPPPLIEKILGFAPGSAVVVEALVDRASRTFYLRRVDAAPTATAPSP